MVTDRLLFGDKAYDEAVNYLLQVLPHTPTSAETAVTPMSH